MTNLVKTSLMIAAILSATLLSACSHENSLDTQSPSVVEDFLIDASAYGEKQLGHKQSFSTGSMYFTCMASGKDADKECPKLYTFMANYAKTSKGPFSSVTLSDITNEKAYAQRAASSNSFFA